MSVIQDLLLTLEGPRLVSRSEDYTAGDVAASCRALKDKAERFLVSSSEFVPESGDTLIGMYNNGALFQTVSGDLRHAEVLCVLAIQICRHYWDKTRSLAWAARLVQPYINLARLAGLKGKDQESVRMLAKVLGFIHGDNALDPEAADLPGTVGVQLLQERGDLSMVVKSTYIRDGAKAFLLTGNVVGLFAFLDECGSDSRFREDTRWIYAAEEARIRALLYQGDPQRAQECLKTLLKRLKRDGIPYLGLLTLAAEVYRRTNCIDSGIQVLKLLGQHVRRVGTGQGHSNIASVTYLLSLEEWLYGSTQAAQDSAMSAFSVFKRNGNAVAALKSAIVLAALENPSNSPSTEQSRERPFTRLLSAEIRRSDHMIERAVGLYLLGQTRGIRTGASATGRALTREAISLTSSLEPIMADHLRRLMVRDDGLQCTHLHTEDLRPQIRRLRRRSAQAEAFDSLASLAERILEARISDLCNPLFPRPAENVHFPCTN